MKVFEAASLYCRLIIYKLEMTMKDFSAHSLSVCVCVCVYVYVYVRARYSPVNVFH